MTETEYSATYLYAYPTRVKTPKPDTSGTQGANTELISEVTYDFNTGLPLTTKDANNQITTISYNDPVTQILDPLLRVRKVTAPNGHQTITEYGAGTSEATRFVKIRSQIDEINWKEGDSWYDGLGRTIKSQSVDSSGDVFTETEYDNMSRPKRATNPYRTGDTKFWTESIFDTAGRSWKVITPDNAIIEKTYGLATSGTNIGTSVTVKDQALKERRSITNALGQLSRVDEPTVTGLGTINSPNQPTNYSYDTLDNLTQVRQIGTTTQQCGGTTSYCVQTRSFMYDSLKRLKQATNPEAGTINYSYDANSNLISKTDARNNTTTYAYDNLNRVKMRSYSDGITPNVTQKYDNLLNAKGKMIEVDNTVSKTKYLSFDTMGRITSNQQITDGTAYNPMTYTYNLSGALIEETYPSGRVVKNTLDLDGDLQQVESRKANDTFKNYANSFNYTAAGAVSAFRLGNGCWENTTFNSRLQPIQIGLGTSATNQSLLKLNFDYGSTDNSGNVKSQTITVPTIGANQGFTAIQTYTYDSLNRIKQAIENIDGNQTPSWKQTYTFDRYGNRRFDTANTTTIPTGCAEAVCNPQIDPTTNRLIGYQFDNAGNTNVDANGQPFTYDAENKQVKVQNGANVIGEYFYDGDGKRVKKYVPNKGETTIFIYDASGKMVAEYSTIVEPSATAKVSYLTNDSLGSPRIITNQFGQVTSRRDFMPFGEEIYSAQRISGLKYIADNIREKFATYERDTETKLDFAQARYFDSGFGRFSSPDDFSKDTQASSPQSWNLYVYVRNNPLRFIDPTGNIIKENGKVKFDEKKKGNKVVKEKRVILDRKLVNGGKVIFSATYTQGTIYADDKTPIEAEKVDETQGVTATFLDENGNITSTTNMTVEEAQKAGVRPESNCFGAVFANQEVWINNDNGQLEKIITGDGYSETTAPSKMNVGLYFDSKKVDFDKVDHAVSVLETNNSGEVTTVGSKDKADLAYTEKPGPGKGTAWQDKGTTLRYFKKKNE